MIIYLVALVLGLWLIMFRYRRRRMYELAALVAAPKEELPIIGVTHTLAGNQQEVLETLQSFSYVAMKQNGIGRSWMNHRLYFLMVDPQDIEIILKQCHEKDDLLNPIRDIVGNGSIIAPVSIWRRRRRILAPAFKPKIIDGFLEIFSKHAESLTTKLRAHAGTGAFDIFPSIIANSFNAVCETAIGVNFDVKHKEVDFLSSLTRVFQITCYRIFHVWMFPKWSFKLFPCYREFKTCMDTLNEFTNEIVAKKQMKFKEENDSRAQTNKHNDHQKSKSFLDYLIEISQAEKGYDNVELREEALTLLLAGTDTSALATSYILVLLSKYPKIQEKAYQEIFEVFKGKDRPIHKEDIQKLKYIGMVIKETLRLFPPAPFTLRKIQTEINLSRGKILPADSSALISIWGVQRDPKYWGPDAEHFRPERFTSEQVKNQHPCLYMPFSTGNRNCVGSLYAMSAIKTTLAIILRKYKIIGEEESSPIPNIPSRIDLTMSAVDGYNVALEERM